MKQRLSVFGFEERVTLATSAYSEYRESLAELSKGLFCTFQPQRQRRFLLLKRRVHFCNFSMRCCIAAISSITSLSRGGAGCLGRGDEIGALRPGMLADIALWRVDTLGHDAVAHAADGQVTGDPVAALVFGPPAPVELLLVGGTPVVERGELRTADVTAAMGEVRAARLRLGAGR